MSDFEWLPEAAEYPFEIAPRDDFGPLTGLTDVTVRLRDMLTGDSYFDFVALDFKTAGWTDDTLDLPETPAGSGFYRAVFDFTSVDLAATTLRLRAEYSYLGEIRGTQEVHLTPLLTG